MKKEFESWCRDAHLYRAKSMPLRTQCERVVSQVFSLGFSVNLNRPRSEERVMTVKKWDTKNWFADRRQESGGWTIGRDFLGNEGQVEEDAITDDG